MNAKDKADYEKLTTPAARADWLVRAAHRDGGITADPDIDPSSLSLRWRVAVLDVALPGPFTARTAEGAIEQGLEWLRKKADAEPTRKTPVLASGAKPYGAHGPHGGVED